MKNTNIDALLKSIFNEELNFDVRGVFDEKLLEYNISKTKALKLLNIDKDVFEEIINGTAKQPNLIHVVKIAEFLNVNVDEFIKIVLRNQSSENIVSIESARKTTFLLKNFDVKTLTKLGFFDKDDSTDLLVQKVLLFFGYLSILK